MGNNNDRKVLQLDRSRTERAFKEGESFWADEIGRIKDRLETHINALDSDMDIEEKPLLSIAILGSPGSGKSSMLHTFVDDVQKGKLADFHGKIDSLPVIKPKLVAKNDHFLYAFLAAALKKEREKKDKEKHDDYRDSEIISPLQQRFRDVSEYLHVIDEESDLQEDDPVGMSMERLERHESGLSLVEKMASFASELANTLTGNSKNSAVLLPVDDADITMDELVATLDAYWRFLRHPRLIPMFTFTGRLAEELLRVHFEKRLTVKGVGGSTEKLKEAYSSLLVSENMAIQYMSRMFPVRNRIRMGPASARVLASKYNPTGTSNEEEKVIDLLQTASRLLFGHVPVPIVPGIVPPLRMVSLRRQIQIVDAMQASGIEIFMENFEESAAGNSSNNKKQSWGQIFDLATWSLLNAHRDVLKEIDLNLDDLYSWTLKGLRQVVLGSILKLALQERSKLLKHWRFRTEDRRSQIISLLAANVFRPRMAGEEPTGDDGPEAIDDWVAKGNNGIVEVMDKDVYSFSTRKGVIWFMELWIGFYLPQILAGGRLHKKGVKEKEGTDTIYGIGWGLMSGPNHAVREALNNKKIFSTGMMFLDPLKFLSKMKGNTRLNLLIHTWCFYGFEEGRPWAAVSLWRGLGLLTQLLKIYLDRPADSDEKRKEHIKALLNKHFQSALVQGKLPKGNIPKNKRKEVTFEKHDFNEIDDSLKSEFVESLAGWIKEFSTEIDDREKRIEPIKQGQEGTWQACFMRRLHGENLLHLFWQDLENVYIKKNLDSWKAWNILTEWKEVLRNYWKGCEGGKIEKLLFSCPLWHDVDNKRFDWKGASLNIERESTADFSHFEEAGKIEDLGDEE